MQADASKLGQVYDNIAATFAAEGLNLPAVEASRCAATWLPHTFQPWHVAGHQSYRA